MFIPWIDKTQECFSQEMANCLYAYCVQCAACPVDGGASWLGQVSNFDGGASWLSLVSNLAGGVSWLSLVNNLDGGAS